MKDCFQSIVPIVKCDKLNINQCQKNDLEKKFMKIIPYASVDGSLIYAQICIRPDIVFVVGV